MKLILVLSFILFYFEAVGAESELKTLCDDTDFSCAKEKVDKFIMGERDFELDELIQMLDSMKGNESYKNNLLGVALLLKKDKHSLAKAEEVLLLSSRQGVNEASQNLAELYFLKDDYERSLLFLNKVREYGYKYPDQKYVNWARLYAQILFLSQQEGIRNVSLSIGLFSEIKNVDTSGVSHYFIGFNDIHSEKVKEGIKYLDKSVGYGNVLAAMLLADLYYVGEILNKDISKAKEYYEMAAALGNGRALYNLAMISQQEKDVTAMKNYLIRSANLGYEKAVILLGKAGKNKN